MSDGRARTLPDGGLRFTLRHLPGMTFVRYPAAVAPPERTMGIVTGHGWQNPAVYRDGAWHTMRGKPIKRQVRHWTACLDVEGRPIGG